MSKRGDALALMRKVGEEWCHEFGLRFYAEYDVYRLAFRFQIKNPDTGATRNAMYTSEFMEDMHPEDLESILHAHLNREIETLLRHT